MMAEKPHSVSLFALFQEFSCISRKKLVILQKSNLIWMKSKIFVYGFAAMCIVAAVAVQKMSADKGQAADIENVVVETKSERNPKAVGNSDVEILAQCADNKGEILLTREGYVTSYNIANKQPNWVGWQLTADHVTGPYLRKGIKFHEDEEVPEPRATDADYRSSGYDRGHMCPSGDNKWSQLAQEQSFLFTNICPQIHGLNAGDWNEMEQQCRKWAEKEGEIYIVCGPIFYGSAKHKRIGKGKIPVPEAFFKVVLSMKCTPKAIGFIYKNQSGNRPKGDYVNTVDQVERITGIDFFPSLPDDVENKIEAEANISDWGI